MSPHGTDQLAEFIWESGELMECSTIVLCHQDPLVEVRSFDLAPYTNSPRLNFKDAPFFCLAIEC